jgi:hypothetical protein
VTVAMSDHDYGLLVEAVGWIEQHAAVDAPEYPHLPSLSLVVDNIAKRQTPRDSKDPRPTSPSGAVVVDLRQTRRDHPTSNQVVKSGVRGPGFPPSYYRTSVRETLS